MNIIHVIPKAKLGGVETAVFSSFHEILNHGYCFRIVSIESDDATYSKGNIDITSLNSSFFSPLGFLRFLKFMKDNKPDLVVFSLWKSALFGLVWQLFSYKRNKVKT
ncbi:hypothetical protein AIQ75_22810, partial [Salmonella enterica]|nr:hypothetical protein [Salmonella enterica]